jgi:hypothetical protein
LFVSDRFVFLELQKTGSTHIRGLLKEVVGGSLMGKHNQVTPELLDGSRVVLGSIRNPWDWYVSLWAFGCGGLGDLHAVATRRRKVRGHGWRSSPLDAVGHLVEELRRDPDEWRRVYADPDDPAAFRRWLFLVHDRLPYQAYDYGTASLGRHVGLMSYRYLHLYCTTAGSGEALDGLGGYETIARFEREHNLVNHFIRNEALEDTFIDALERSGVQLTDAQLARIRGRQRLNTSSRRRDTSYFYDAGAAALVHERERLLIDRFGYVGPLAAVLEEEREPAAARAVDGALVAADSHVEVRSA